HMDETTVDAFTCQFLLGFLPTLDVAGSQPDFHPSASQQARRLEADSLVGSCDQGDVHRVLLSTSAADTLPTKCSLRKARWKLGSMVLSFLLDASSGAGACCESEPRSTRRLPPHPSTAAPASRRGTAGRSSKTHPGPPTRGGRPPGGHLRRLLHPSGAGARSP